MTTAVLSPQLQPIFDETCIKQTIDSMINNLLDSFPDPKGLTAEARRGIIARYSAVLEGNFIYWMTATYLSVHSAAARPILLDNLHEEVRDSHPVMLRKFAIAAHAFPTDADALILNDELTGVRLFLGRLSGVQSLVTMAFFEGFIQRFMPYLASLAEAQGSDELEYTDVHGVCDVAHTQGLFDALFLEMVINPLLPEADLFEGVHLLRVLIHGMVHSQGDGHPG